MKKQSLFRTILSLALVVCMLMSFAAPAFAADDDSISFEQVDNSVISGSTIEREPASVNAPKDAHEDSDVVRVSIVLSGDSVLDAGYSTTDITNNAGAMKHLDKVKGNQKNLEKKIAKAIGKNLNVKWNLGLAANAISATVAYGDISTIEAVDGVQSVILENRYNPCSTVSAANPNMAIASANMTGVQQAWQEGYTGAGARIAIIDTGLDVDHQSFNNDAFLYALEQDAAAAGKKLNPYVQSLDLLGAKQIGKALPYLNASAMSASPLSVEDLGISDKIPYAFNYVDGNTNVTHLYDTQGEHGSHVSGIATANRYLKTEEGFMDAVESVYVAGNAPDAQILVMKVFGQGGGAYDSDYMAAIEDAILLGCDSVNLSLGSGAAGMTTNTTYQAILDKLVTTDTVVVMSAGNSGAWAEQTPYGELYVDDVNFDTAGSPGSYANSFAVASVDNDGMVSDNIEVAGKVYGYSESATYGNAKMTTLAGGNSADYEYVFLDGYGEPSDFAGIDVSGKVVFCSRGVISFFEKANNAAAAGAAATIIYNNTTGIINLNLTGYTYKAPCVSISQDAAAAIRAASTQADGCLTGTVTINSKPTAVVENAERFTMSSFSSWGVPGDLSLKPEITAPGGNIYSVAGTNNTGSGMAGGTDQYKLMSGTSMAAPQITGMTAVLKRYIEQNGISKNGITDRALAQSLLMSTATPMVAPAGYIYSPLQQGAGLANVADAMNAATYITMSADATASAFDGKVKAELGDDPEKTGSYSFSFTMKNITKKAETYTLSADVFTQATDGDFLYGKTAGLDASVSFSCGNTVTVNKNQSVTITATITLSDAAKAYLNETYPAGAYVEAYVNAKAQGDTSDHSIPVLAYYGSWTDPSMFDKGSFMDYNYGTEDRVPYLYETNDVYGNAYTITFAGESDEYYFGGNLYAKEATYTPEFNALNNQNGDKIDSVYYALIRNAGARAVVVSDADTGEVYAASPLGAQQSAYYYDNGSAWKNTQSSVGLNWTGTDGNGEPLPEGTHVKLSLVAMPEYYAAADGSYDLASLGEGAYFSTEMTIDNTAPELKAVANDEDSSISIAAIDNENIAAILLFSADGAELVGRMAVGAPEVAGKLASGLDADVYLLQVIDYAGNAATYRLFLNTEETNTVESITLNRTSVSLVKGNSIALTADVQPITLADRSVVFSSSDETVATVTADGVVTAVGKGSCTITAAAAADPEATAQCAVEVIEIATDLNGIVWDEEGAVWFSQFNTADLPNYQKLNESSWNLPINAIAKGADGTMYASDLDTAAGISNVYTLDPASLTLNLVGTSSIAYTDLADAPNMGGVLMGTYFNYIVLVDPTTGGYVSAFDYCPNELVAMTYCGSVFNTNYGQYIDTYYLLDSKGNLYFEAFINMGGSYYYFNGSEGALFASTGITTDTPYFQSMYFDGEMTYVSNYVESKDCVTMYAVDTEARTPSVFKLGKFNDGVWPVAGLTQMKTVDASSNAAFAALAEAECEAEATTEISVPASFSVHK